MVHRFSSKPSTVPFTFFSNFMLEKPVVAFDPEGLCLAGRAPLSCGGLCGPFETPQNKPPAFGPKGKKIFKVRIWWGFFQNALGATRLRGRLVFEEERRSSAPRLMIR